MKNIVVSTYLPKLRTTAFPEPEGRPCSTLRCRPLSLLSADCPPPPGLACVVPMHLLCTWSLRKQCRP